MSKFMLIGAVFCAIDAVILLLAFDSFGGFLLGGFGFVIGVFCSAVMSYIEE